MAHLQRLKDFEDYCRRRHDRQNEADAFKEAIEEIERLRAAARPALDLLERVPPSISDDVPIETIRQALRAALVEQLTAVPRESD